MNELDILNKKYGGIVTAIHRGRYVKYSGGEMDDKFFETLDEKQFYEQNFDKESKEIQKILDKIEKKLINKEGS